MSNSKSQNNKPLLTWSDRQGQRERKAWLIFIKHGNIYIFKKNSIKKVATVMGFDSEKGGKCSNKTYKIKVNNNARVIYGHEGWNSGTFIEGLIKALKYKFSNIDTWQDLSKALDVTILEAQRFLKIFRPSEARHFDKVAEGLEEPKKIGNDRPKDGYTLADLDKLKERLSYN